ncbi:DNA-binding domain-containing protein [Pseudoalteromonas ostreae]|uniref:HvfC/BufC N-terminal domain-containing protein n=1 Tax=Pseudoalteromonas ostreae TaxID=2774154 RepID=UPI001B38F403|nr:DNA-binding domain-containing protein [Pseudoalteromonas ostreae]
MNEITLKQTQEWMMALLGSQGSLEQKVIYAARQANLPLAVLAKDSLESTFYRRLNIYAAGYVIRLVECLKSEYQTLERYMGEAVFVNFAKAYIITLPSTNPSLYDLGKGFSLFLEQTRPAGGQYSSAEEVFFNLPAEIARIERAKAEVSLAKGFEGEIDEDPLILEHLSLFQHSLNVETPACLRLVKLNYPLLYLMEQVALNKEYNMPEVELNFLAFSRVNYQLSILTLEFWQFEFLTICQQESHLGRCIDITSVSSGLEKGDLLARLMFWLPSATTHGLLKVTN